MASSRTVTGQAALSGMRRYAEQALARGTPMGSAGDSRLALNAIVEPARIQLRKPVPCR